MSIIIIMNVMLSNKDIICFDKNVTPPETVVARAQLFTSENNIIKEFIIPPRK